MAVCNRAPGPAGILFLQSAASAAAGRRFGGYAQGVSTVDTIIVKPRPDAPIKLMYGVPPARFEKMEAPEKQLKKE